MRKYSRKINKYLFIYCAPFFLLGCSSGKDDLTQWVSEQKRTIKPSVKSLDAPVEFVPVDYVGGQSMDPFDVQKLTRTLLPAQHSRGNDLIAAEENRRRQPLESYPLDTMTMVGTLDGERGLIALVKVDGLLYQVFKGNYLGQNYGLIQSIGDQGVVLREIVQDAAGEWIERTSTLELQEK